MPGSSNHTGPTIFDQSADLQRVIGAPTFMVLRREDPSWTKEIDEAGTNNGLIHRPRGHMVVDTTIGTPSLGICTHTGSTRDTKCDSLPISIAQAVSRRILTEIRDTSGDFDTPQIEKWLDQSMSYICTGVQRGDFNCQTLRAYADASGQRTGIPMNWQTYKDGTASVILTHLKAKDTQNPAQIPELELRFVGGQAVLEKIEDSENITQESNGLGPSSNTE